MKNKQLEQTYSSPKNSLAAIFFVFGALHIYSTLVSEKKNYFQLFKIAIGMFKPLLPSVSIAFCLSLIFVRAIELLQ